MNNLYLNSSMNVKKIFINSILFITLSFWISSCSTPKDVAYFQGIQNAEVFTVAAANEKAIKVEPFDKLSIIVSSQNPALAQMFNLPVYSNSYVNKSSTIGGADYRNYNVGYNEGIAGFTVSAEGTIDYPLLGVIKVEGMTRNELAAFIKGEIMGKGLIKDPIVTVEFLNVGVSVLGEVTRPGRYDLNTDLITIVEALSLAGDLTIQGRRENVTVIRKEGDKVQTYLVDLTNTNDMLNSPAYYLKQGDVVYVEPNNIRKRQTTNNGNNIMNVSFWLSVASLLTTAAVLLK